MRSVRSMLGFHPSKQLGVVKLVLVAGIALLLLTLVHLEGEISRLDEARDKLEQVMAISQNEEHAMSRRDVSTSYDRELPKPGDIDDTVLIYNRVPKTGSTSFAGVAYDLCVQNKFNVLHLNVSKNNHVLGLSDQRRFVLNITHWESKKPALYHGHLAYLPFSRFGISRQPLYINIIRDPLDRLVSYYYFLRHGDDFRPYLKRSRSGNKETFDECVASDGEDCDPMNLWMQIPFFCGHAAECWIPGNPWALETAKYNLVHNYLVVGLTEELGDFVAILEATLPRFFSGATELFNSGHKSHLRKTSSKVPPSQETLDKIQQTVYWKMEHEFYEFAKEQFHFIKKRTLQSVDGVLSERKPQFMYEKIRPR